MKESTHFICERDTDRLLLPYKIEKKSDNYIEDTLYSNYLEACHILFNNISSFEECLDHQNIVVESDITE